MMHNPSSFLLKATTIFITYMTPWVYYSKIITQMQVLYFSSHRAHWII